MICRPVYDAINFEINLSFLIKPFFYITQKSSQKFKYLTNEKSFSNHAMKTIFHHSYRAFVEANRNNYFLEGKDPIVSFLKICQRNMEMSTEN